MRSTILVFAARIWYKGPLLLLHIIFLRIHPRDKLDVARRLALSGRAVAYNETTLSYQGPIPSSVHANARQHTLVIEFDHGNNPIEVRDTNHGFDVSFHAHKHCHDNVDRMVTLCAGGHGFLRSNFSSFPQYFNISNFKSPITYIFVKCGCSNIFFLNSANLICRGTDISKYLIESLGIPDNESRVYIV